MTPLRIVLADDEPPVVQGLRLVLESDPRLEVVAEAGDGVEALHAAREHRPDLLLTDIRMPRLDGLALVRAVHQDPTLASTRVIVLTTFADDEYLVEAIRSGAVGYLLKSMPPAEIRWSVHAALEGGLPLAASLTRRLVEEYAGRRVARDPRLDRLTGREADVLRRIAAGESNAEIAIGLHIGEGTVKTHVAAILRKLEVRDRTQAAVTAYESGLVRPGG